LLLLVSGGQNHRHNQAHHLDMAGQYLAAAEEVVGHADALLAGATEATLALQGRLLQAGCLSPESPTPAHAINSLMQVGGCVWRPLLLLLLGCGMSFLVW
jgi:hypothetical protein